LAELKFGVTSFPDDAFYLSGKNSAFFNLKARVFLQFLIGVY